MEIVQLRNSIHLIGIQADAFPQGVAQAHEQLKASVTAENERSIYGISHPLQNGSIKYLAAASRLSHDQGIESGFETFTIRKGAFLTLILKGWKENTSQIQEAFRQLIADPRIEKNGYCLEEYISETTLRCMVPLAAEEKPEEEREKLIEEMDTTFDRLYKALSAFEEEEINTVPFEGSWTAGQVTEHIIKSIEGIPDTHTTEANRFHDQKVLPLQELFLNMDLKFKTDPFLAPSEPSHDTKSLFKTLGRLEAQHKATAARVKLEALCLDMEFPTFGYLTRYEWLRFMMFHTQRHTQQIVHIHKSLIQTRTLR